MINIAVINECTDTKLPFPEVIRQLSAIGIERYYTDLIRMEKTYYSQNDESYIARLAISDLPVIGSQFNEKQVIEAIHSIQKNQIDYDTFVRNILVAGTVSYTVYFTGKRAIYSGRNGHSHSEVFSS